MEEEKKIEAEEPTEILGNTNVIESVAEETAAAPVDEETPVVEAPVTEEIPVAETPAVEEPAVEQPTPEVPAEPTPVETASVTPTSEEPKKKGSNKLLIIIALLVLVLGGGYAVWAFVLGGNTQKESIKKEEEQKEENKEEEKKEEEQKEEETTTKPDNQDLTVEDIPDRLSRFIKAALTDQLYGRIANKFLEGTDKIEQIDKYALAIYASDNTIMTSENIPSNYNEDQIKYLVNPHQKSYMITFEEFGKKYKEIANEEFDVNYMKTHSIKNDESDERISTCPFLYDVNEENKVLVLSNQCGGSSDRLLYRQIYDYNIENGNHVIYQYAGYRATEHEPVKTQYFITLKGKKVEVDQFEGNEKEFSTIIWKFDKDFNFINTEIIDN